MEEEAAHNDLGALVAGLPVAVYRTSADGRILYANQALADLLRARDPAEMLGYRSPDFYVNQDDRAFLLEQLRRFGEVRGMELALRRRDGEVVQVELWGTGRYAADGTLEGLEGTLVDVTQRLELERELMESEDLFRALFERAPVGICVIGPDLRFERVNAALAAMVGRSPAEMVGTRAELALHPDDVADASARFTALLSGEIDGYQVDRRVQHRNGHWVWVLLTVSALRDAKGNLQHVVSQALDISEAKEAMDALVESEARFYSAFADAPIGMFLTRADGMAPMQVNRAMCEMVGLSEADLVGRPIADLLHPDDLEDARTRVEMMQSGEMDGYSVERRLRHADGHYLLGRVSVSPLRDVTGLLTAVLAQVIDITEQEESVAALQAQEQQLRAVLDGIPDMMFRIGAEGDFRWWRPSREFPPAVDPQQFLGKTIYEIFPEQAEYFMGAVKDVVVSRAQRGIEYEMSLPGLGLRWFEARLFPIAADEVLAIVRDITHWKEPGRGSG